MNFNITILGQTVSFVIFVMLCMKFVWPPIIKAIEIKQLNLKKSLEMQKKIKLNFKNSEETIQKTINHAHSTAYKIIKEAEINKDNILAQAELEAIKKRDAIISQAYFEIAIQRQRVRKKLQDEISDLSILIAQKIIINTLHTGKDINMLKKIIPNLLYRLKDENA